MRAYIDVVLTMVVVDDFLCVKFVSIVKYLLGMVFLLCFQEIVFLIYQR